MTTTMAENVSNSFNVVSWNIFLDKTRAKNNIIKYQKDRVESQAKTLAELGLELDAVLLHEVEGKHGARIAELTGYEPGHWEQHNRKNEHIGAFGQSIDAAKFFDIGHDRKIVKVMMGNLAVFGLHLSARPKRYFMRVEEMEAVCELIDQEDEALIAGDFNGIRQEKARRMLARRGFSSVFRETGGKPPFYPTDKYRDILWTPKQQRVLGRWVSIDDMLVRGVTVQDAGAFEGDSDHFGLHATLAA